MISKRNSSQRSENILRYFNSSIDFQISSSLTFDECGIVRGRVILISLTGLINKNEDLRKTISDLKLKKYLVDWNGEKIHWNETPILVPSIGASWEGSVIGTAFDYMARAILTRHVGYENAIRHAYVAEKGLELLEGDLRYGNLGIALFMQSLNRNDIDFTRNPERKERRKEEAKGVVNLPKLLEFLNAQYENATTAMDQFIQKNIEIEVLAPHALFLAKLDPVYRNHAELNAELNVIDVYFEKYENQTFPHRDNALSDEEIIGNIIKLSHLFEEQISKMNIKSVNCNPDFNSYSEKVRGADADFIIDKTLIDVKTVKTLGYRTEMMAQILGYASMAKAIDIPVDQVGIYYARFAQWALLPLKVLPKDFLDNYLKKILEAANR